MLSLSLDLTIAFAARRVTQYPMPRETSNHSAVTELLACPHTVTVFFSGFTVIFQT